MKTSFVKKIANGFITASLKAPRSVYIVVLAAMIFMLVQLPKINIDTDPENMLSSDNPARLFHAQTKAQFNLFDAIVLGVVNENGMYTPESLAITKTLSDFVMGLDGVVHREVIAPNLADNIVNLDQGTLSFSWLMDTLPKTLAESVAIQDAIARLPLLQNTMASSDGKAIAIYIPLERKDDSYAIGQKLREFITELPQDHHYYITGLPIAENQFGFEMFVQMAISAPLAGAMIFALLWVFLRQSIVVMGAMLIAMSTVIITMGSLIGLGFSVHILSSMIAIFLMPIAVVDAIHVLSEFKEKLQANRLANITQSTNAVIRDVISDLFQPMLFTTLTSAVGFLSLMLTPIPPVKVFGGFVALGIVLAFVLTMTLLPAYLSRLSEQSIARLAYQDDNRKNMLSSALNALAAVSQRRSKGIIFALALITCLGLIGINKIIINDNPVRWFKSDHQISIADKVLNKHFAGTYNAYLVLTHQEEASQQQQLEKIYAVLEAAQLPMASLPEQANPAELMAALDNMSFELTLTTSQQQAIDSALVQLDILAQQGSSFYQPQKLAYIDALAKHLRTNEHVGKVNALSDVVKTVNRELVSGQEHDYRIPNSTDGVAQVLLQYQSSHRPSDLAHFVTPDRQATLLWLQLKSGDNQAMQDVIASTQAYMSQHPLPQGIKSQWAGKAYINVIWQQDMVAGMLESLASAFVFVLLMMLALFRSIRYGLLAMLPLSITIIGIYGLIGWVGKDYDMPIAVLSSLTLGLSVDFAIHFIERYRQLLQQSKSVSQAIHAMFNEPARAISRNALVIAFGFTPLLFAPLVPYVTVGLFLASIMIISAIVTLTLIPAILTVGHQRSLRSHKTAANTVCSD